MSSKYIKKYEIPVGFQDLLSEFTKEILRNQPKDIIDFGVEYFKCLQQGLILDYAHKGENIPCDFKPAVPKIPQSLKNLKNPIMESVSQIQKPEKVEPSTQQKEPPSIKIEDEKDVIDKNEIKEKISTKIIAIKQNEEEKKIIKEKVGNILSASEEASKVNKSSPLVTKTLGKTSNYLNCIDFEEKEEVLKKLKENNEIEKEIEEYIDKDFEPNKNINNLVSLLQKTIMAYYLSLIHI